jgi:peptidoglycan hydrolase-like protein with peptidoglycan-binding domain
MVLRPDDEQIPLSRFSRRLNRLSNRVYRLNVRMLRLLEDGHLGNRAPQEDAEGARLETGDPILELGAHGGAVFRLQRSLQAAGLTYVPADGHFGPTTYRAVRSLQASRELEVDGIVGPRTWASLPER